MSRRARLTTSYISRIERGKTKKEPTVHALRSLAKALGTTLASLRGGQLAVSLQEVPTDAPEAYKEFALAVAKTVWLRDLMLNIKWNPEDRDTIARALDFATKDLEA